MTQELAATAEGIATAAELLRAGDLVSFPTETVYGLGADATNDHAVAAIFAAKDRPQFNPLIVHVADKAEAHRIVDFNPDADRLAEAFWPGALTLVLPRTKDCAVSLLVSAGLDTVAVRVPNHKTAQDLLRATDRPVAAPSANPSGQISPTTAAHVMDGLSGRLAAILDGGNCTVGIESTVVDVSGPTPVLLRPGGISFEDLAKTLPSLETTSGSPDAPKSPGMMERHYAPNTPLRLNATKAENGEALLGFGPEASTTSLNLSPSANLTEAAANLFAMMRELDESSAKGIAVMAIPEIGLGRAINDRLRRAATP
ncbi:MAG: threonylcarbamoyl-AMP synthase [Rhodospirillaceae bacterium]|jgi:L-threonylcarbamoyladenylate synthase|nr:threonylcarbamoyl-AMP synthase [Rhodospirillales bacterium]MBT3905201.1 threonylcarbamoyl-AMP synthase [Rhodospirillaceae bacterium]MBT4701627.1 threonylcarbamoyl-AMP synthase [Rhodospirillaceae bacterium]MBT5035773.1 threonylcarbamoyl-AMP synthase [Rhodospirillaceae bacterium]MBT6218776.1 threonylcarbamoyl-AMP synthase [Rhodospirillaceae bacterium]